MSEKLPLWMVLEEIDSRVGDVAEPPRLLSVSARRGIVPFDELFPDRIARADSFSMYKLVAPNEIVINRMSAATGAVGISTLSGMVSPDYAVLRVRKGADPLFLARLIGSQWFTDLVVQPLLRGIGVGSEGGVRTPRVNISDLLSSRIALPPLETQRRIADYLDKETAEIDAMVRALDEYTDLNNRRFDQFVREKLSVGDRRVVPIFTLGAIRSGDAISADEIHDTGLFPVYGGNGIRGYAEMSNQNGPKVLIGRQGALSGNVHLVRGEFFASEHALVFTPNSSINIDWLEFALRHADLGRLSQAAAQPGISASEVVQQRILLPSRREQDEIATRLRNEANSMTAMTDIVESLRSLLIKRRQVLINDVVTGKKQV